MAKRPHAIGNVLSELIARRGYAGVQSAEAYEQAWRQAAGDFLAGQTRIGRLRRGVLELVVANSILVQEITYQKPALLEKLAELMPDHQINDFKLRVGAVQ